MKYVQTEGPRKKLRVGESMEVDGNHKCGGGREGAWVKSGMNGGVRGDDKIVDDNEYK